VTGSRAERRPPPRPGAGRRALGRVGEDAAAAWYEAHGYDVLDRNWRCREGELDLVARRGSVVVMCEVKTRSGSAFGAPFEAVTITKQRRIRVLAVRWLAGHATGGADVRFDVASVTLGSDGLPRVEVLEEAF